MAVVWSTSQQASRCPRPPSFGGSARTRSTELRAATRRITELEAELATVKLASELFAQGRVVRPKVLCPIVETLASEGHGTKRV